MNIIDLSHLIENGMQIYPGDPAPSIERALTHESDYCHVDRLNLGSHTGTHIDAPFHFLSKGKKISEFTADKFIGKGVVVDVRSKKENEGIVIDDVKPYEKEITRGCFVLFMTGWSQYFGQEMYEKHPYVTKECAQWLREKGISIVGTDGLNIDSTVTEQFDAHDIFLTNDILIVENLTNLENVPTKSSGWFSFLPLRVSDTDGSPIRAVYIESIK